MELSLLGIVETMHGVIILFVWNHEDDSLYKY
jgi:hypothetical protein